MRAFVFALIAVTGLFAASSAQAANDFALASVKMADGSKPQSLYVRHSVDLPALQQWLSNIISAHQSSIDKLDRPTQLTVYAPLVGMQSEGFGVPSANLRNIAESERLIKLYYEDLKTVRELRESSYDMSSSAAERRGEFFRFDLDRLRRELNPQALKKLNILNQADLLGAMSEANATYLKENAGQLKLVARSGSSVLESNFEIPRANVFSRTLSLISSPKEIELRDPYGKTANVRLVRTNSDSLTPKTQSRRQVGERCDRIFVTE